MHVKDLKISDSTLGVLEKRGYGVETLVENRKDLTKLKGIGPGRSKELQAALTAAGLPPEATVSDLPALTAGASAPEPAPEKGGGETSPAPFEADEGAAPGSLVRYMDPSQNVMMARVAANLGNGRLNLQAFTGAGGAHRVEDVPRAGEWGEPGRWAPVEAV